MLEIDAELVSERDGILLITDKGFASRELERSLSENGITLLRPSPKDEAIRPGEPVLKKVRQLIESDNDTLKGQLTWNNMAEEPMRESLSGSLSVSSRSRQRSGATSTPDKTSAAPSSPSTTNRNWAH